MILVVGATGVVGGMIARRLLEKDQEVRVLVRRDSPSSQLIQQGLATSAEELIEAGAQPVHGDLRDRASLDAAVEGVETVITTANSAMRGGADNPQSVDLQGNRNLIEAARAAGVEHFIFVSLLGADVNNPAPFVQAKAQSESALRESGMEYTILAPTAFMEVWPAMVVGMPTLQGRSVTLVGEGRRHHSFVSNRDVAAFAAAAVDHPAAQPAYTYRRTGGAQLARRARDLRARARPPAPRRVRGGRGSCPASGPYARPSGRHGDVRLGHRDGGGLPHLRRHADEARDVRAGAGRTLACMTFATTVRVSTGRFSRPGSRPLSYRLAGIGQEKIVHFADAAHLPGR